MPPSRPGDGGLDIEPSGAGWWLPVLARAVTSFTEPGATVLLLPWPTAAPCGHAATVPADAVTAVTELGRRPRFGHLPEPPGADHSQPDDADGRTDLLITVMPARDDTAGHTDTVARLAARALRLGGVLAVVTHCNRTAGVLLDPTGPMVTAGQNADLLYLQHIVAVHLPPADLRLHGARRAHDAADGQAPRPHLRVHSDVLVFAQPHDDTALPAAARPSRP